MIAKTLHKLEFHKVRELLASHASNSVSFHKCLQVEPTDDLKVINQRLSQTEEAMEMLRFQEPDFLANLINIDNVLAKAKVGGLLTPAEIRAIYQVLRASRLAAKNIQSTSSPCLSDIVIQLYYNLDLETQIDKCIDEEGQVRDHASPELRSCRSQMGTLRNHIRSYLQDFIKSGNNQKLLQDAIVTERDGRYVVPVKQEYRYEVKGIVHDESASGATVFIEPLPVVELNNRIRQLQQEEKREIERILMKLGASLAVYHQELKHNQDTLGELDFAFARARLAYKMEAYRPEVNTAGILELSRARHPLLGKEAVPINIRLGDNYDTLVITGANTGGKTVALKTTGLLVLMALTGMFIPAREKSKIPLFKSIYVDIGDEQSIEQSLSTFSSHMTNIIDILNVADNHSLVLIDELGAGTDPAEGAALARVILEELFRKGSKVIVTTHQSELKYYAYQHERIENACVEFDPINLKPTYHLTIGTPGQSNAFEIAARLGLNRSLVEEAKRLVPEHEMELSNMIREFRQKSFEYDVKNREIQRLQDELAAQMQNISEEKARMAKEQQEWIARIRNEADQYLRSAKREANEVVNELRELIKDKENPPKWHEIEQRRQRIKQIEVDLPSIMDIPYKASESVKPGDYVYVTSINQKGYVMNAPNNQGEVTVQCGILKLNVKTDQIKPMESPDDQRYKQRNQSFLEKAKYISKEIDLRGKLAEEAIEEIDKYLDDAALIGLDSVRIIHGKGTGALRKAVRSYLHGHHHVKSIRDGHLEEGGYGVTVVELR